MNKKYKTRQSITTFFSTNPMYRLCTHSSPFTCIKIKLGATYKLNFGTTLSDKPVPRLRGAA